MQHIKNNTTDYLVIYRNAQKANEAFNEIHIPRVVQEHGMKILYSLHATGFDALQDDDKK